MSRPQTRGEPRSRFRLVARFAFLLTVALCPRNAAAQSVPPSLPAGAAVLHPAATSPDSIYVLPHMFVAAGTDTLVLDSTVVLKRETDYLLFERHGSVRFLPPFWQKSAGMRVPAVSIRFRYFPFTLRDVYARREIVVVRDSTDTLRVARPVSSFSLDDIFGGNLQKSGSLFRGFTVGTNRDLSLSSGLRLQLAGHITQDIEIAAALTDENTPIQPEGTTQTLQEFDKVYVEIKGRDLAATLGDFDVNIGGTEFAQLSRKLQGAKGSADYRFGFSDGSVLAAGAITRGKFNTVQFNGIEGVQGPYLLTGRNGERAIIVVAGTERVYVDGEQMVRGETNDYIIDYSIGEVTFTTRRLITAASRITIDFEYSDRQFSRSLLAAQTKSTFFSDRARLTFTFLREADDPNAPIDLDLTDSVRQAIAAAGSDRNKAVVNGVTRVDSNGSYVRVDSVLAGGSPVSFYRYAPGDPAAKYNIFFSQVGAGKGDYARRQAGVFDYRGPGGGDYVSLRYLPLPQSQQMVDVVLDGEPVRELKLSGEFAGTLLNPNRLSLQNVSENGHGIHLAGEWKPAALRLGSLNLGRLDLALQERYTGSTFSPLDRTQEIEFGRKWGLDSLTQSSEEIQEATLKYSPDSAVTIGGGYGKNVRGSGFRSVRNDGALTVRAAGLPSVDYTLESIRSRDDQTGVYSSWLRDRGMATQTFGIFSPRVSYEGERRTFRSAAADVLAGSFAFDSFGGGVLVKGPGPFSASADIGWRSDDLASGGSLERESRSFTQSYTARLSDWHTLSSQMDVTLRNRTFTPVFQALGNLNVRSVLVRNQTRYSPFNRGVETDLVYEVSTERTSRLQRVFTRVTIGSGNYKYLGDLNHNGLADESEFVPARFDGDYVAVTVPSDDLVPVIDLRTGWRVRLTPARFIQADGTASSILSALSSETYFRVEEKSTERNLAQIYLLHLSRFLQDSTTINGTRLFTQDLFVLDGNPLFSARFRFSDRRGLNNYSGGLERSYSRERSVRLRLQLIPELSQQLDYVNRTDKLISTEQSSQARSIEGNDLTLDFAYRPEQDLEVGLKIETARSTDVLPAIPVRADLNTETMRGVYAFRGAGQLRAQMGREEMQLSYTPDVFPYELTGGRVAGITWVWNLAFDYRVTQFLQATVNYDGRSEGGSPPIHTARAEVRAFF